MTSENTARLEAKKITVGYGNEPDIVSGASISVYAGQIACIVGPNGVGKSTVLSAMAGILPPRSGRILLSGAPLSEMGRNTRAKKIGYLPQIVRPSIPYTVYELISLGRYAHQSGFGFAGEQDRKAIERAMELTRTAHLATRRFSEISGGERQRALIASVLAAEPEVILLDEPTASLDIGKSCTVFENLETLANNGAAVAVVTHDLNLAGQFAKQMYLLSANGITAGGPPMEVLVEAKLKAAYGDGFELVERPDNPIPAVLPARQKRSS